MKRRLLIALSFLLSINTLNAQTDVANAQQVILGQVPSQEGEIVPMRNTHPDAQWFPNAGLGLFIHFGLAANHGGIDLSWGMFANKRWEDGEIAPVDYWAMADGWNPKKLNFDDIMQKAAKAGFKYAVFTTKHHDGYTFWPSKFSSFGVQTTMGGRDIVKEYVEACRKHNIKVGFYYSPVDWLFDAEYINWDQSGETILDIHHHQIDKLPIKPESHEKARQEMVANHVRELLTNYGKIDLIWFDGGKGEISNDEVRELQPGIVINRRNGPGGIMVTLKEFYLLNVLQVGLKPVILAGLVAGGVFHIVTEWTRQMMFWRNSLFCVLGVVTYWLMWVRIKMVVYQVKL